MHAIAGTEAILHVLAIEIYGTLNLLGMLLNKCFLMSSILDYLLFITCSCSWIFLFLFSLFDAFSLVEKVSS